MALSSCMWTGVSGLLAHGEKMNVVGNNIANVSTVGFKSQRMDFADFVYQSTYTNGGLAQVGRGVKIGAIMQDFSTGAYESSNEATDLSINGRGFFKVKKTGSDQTYYTRAGNFRFDNQGFLVDPNGLAVQGWKVNNDGGVRQAAGGMNLDVISEKKQSDIIGSGVPTDIQLATWTVLPQQTTNMTFSVNLPADGADKTTDSTNPFAALLQAWDGTQSTTGSNNTEPMPESAYDYATTMEIYDEAGTKHTVTVYFDKVDGSTYGDYDSSKEMWEYVVTMDPSEDQRMFFDTNTGTLRKMNETEMGGVLATGTMTFAKNGSLINQSAYTWGGSLDPTTSPNSFEDVQDPSDPLNTLKVIKLNPEDLNNWYPAAISTSGLPIVVANFSGVLDAQTSGSPRGVDYNIELDFGLKIGNYTMPWENNTPLGALQVDAYAKNTSYDATDPKTGSEFILLNPDYDPSLDMLADINGFKYLINGVTNLTDQQNALAQLYGSNTKITIKAGSLPSGDPAETITFDVPAGSIVATGSTTAPFYTYTGGLAGITATYSDGTAYTPNAADLADLTTAIEANAEAKVRGAKMVDKSMLSAATPVSANDIAEMNKPLVISSNACTSFSGSFASSQSQDGYGYGDLASWNVDQDGILYGVYSNGVTLPLWQLCLYDFTCTQGLRREGNNLFTQTRQSGEAKSGPAGVAGLGSINGYSLEQSNVDMSTEFVQMISTQRGFQANSKVITTTDTMLDTVINMKR